MRAWVVLVAVVLCSSCGGRPLGTPRATPRAEGLALRGVVLDTRGVAAAGVAIWIDDERRATTDANGSFEIDGIVAGTHEVEAIGEAEALAPLRIHVREGRGHVTLQLERAWAMEVRVTDDDGRPIRGAVVDPKRRAIATDPDGIALVRNAQEAMRVSAPGFGRGKTGWGDRGADDVMRLDVGLRRGASVEGTLEGAAGLGEVKVWIRMDRGVIDDVAIVDAQGRWRIDALPAGPATLSVHRDRLRLVEQRIELDGAPTTMPLTLPPLATVRGVVVDATGLPVAGADVYAAPSVHARTDATGRYELAGLPRRRLTLSASRAARASEVVEVDLTAGDATQSLTLEHGELRGRVVDADGRPLPDVRVTARERRGFRMRTFPRTGDVTAADGGFVLGPVVPGEHRVELALRGASAQEELHTEHDVRAGDDVTLSPTPVGALRATIVRLGMPVTDYTVSIATAEWGLPFVVPERVRSTSGDFHLPRVPAGQPLVVGIHGAGFVEQALEIEVPVAATLDLGTIIVFPGRTVTGRVVDRDGAPVADAWVVAGVGDAGARQANQWRQGRYGQRVAVTDADGAFTLDHLPDEARLAAGHREAGRSKVVTTTADEVALRLIRTGTVRGTVHRATADRGLLVTLRNKQEHLSAPVQQDGTFEIADVLPGMYEAMAGAGRKTGPAVDVEVSGGVTATVELEAPR